MSANRILSHLSINALQKSTGSVMGACQEVDLRSLLLTQIHSVIQRSSVNIRGRSLTAQSPKSALNKMLSTQKMFSWNTQGIFSAAVPQAEGPCCHSHSGFGKQMTNSSAVGSVAPSCLLHI